MTLLRKFIQKIKGRWHTFLFRRWYPAIYRRHAKRPIKEKLVLFADEQFASMPDNFAPLYQRCKADGFRCELMLLPNYVTARASWLRAIQRHRYRVRFLKRWARCKVLFLEDYFPLVYLTTVRPETQVVQLWHGCGALKIFGYAAANKSWGMSAREMERNPIHINYSLACVSGPKAVDPFARAFNAPQGVVQDIGVPRTDIYFDEGFKAAARQKVRDAFPGIGERKIILYAPTFRGNSLYASYFNLNMDPAALADALGDRYALVLKLHPLLRRSGFTPAMAKAYEGFVFDATHVLSTEEVLCAADILITDYSSILFEYLLLERPVISYIYDINKYTSDRGFFYPYEETAPGPYVHTQAELIERLQTVDQWFDVERVRRFRQDFMSACDGHSAQRIYEYVFGTTTKEEKA